MPIGLQVKKTESFCLIWLFAPSVLWRRKDFGSIPKKSLLEAKTLRFETEGVTVCGLEFDSSPRFFVFADLWSASINNATLSDAESHAVAACEHLYYAVRPVLYSRTNRQNLACF